MDITETRRFPSTQALHPDDKGHFRVILDRRRSASHPRPMAHGSEAHPPERRSTRAQNWKDGQLIVETGFPQ